MEIAILLVILVIELFLLTRGRRRRHRRPDDGVFAWGLRAMPQ